MEAEALGDTLSDMKALVDTLSYSQAKVEAKTLGDGSQPACRPVPAHRSVCRLASLPPPLLAFQLACRQVLTQVSQRVDQWLRIAQCVA